MRISDITSNSSLGASTTNHNGSIESYVVDWFKNAFSGDRDYNRQMELQKQAQSFNAQEAQKARDFEERMSNTSYQRAVADMVSAGFAPALLSNQGGASTPHGVSASSAVGNAGKSGQGASQLIGYLFSMLGSAVSASIRSSALEASKEIQGRYTIDATKLKNNNALLVAKAKDYGYTDLNARKVYYLDSAQNLNDSRAYYYDKLSGRWKW